MAFDPGRSVRVCLGLAGRSRGGSDAPASPLPVREGTTIIAARIGIWAGTARCRRPRPEFTALDYAGGARIRRTDVRPICRRRAISALLMPARCSFRTWLAWSPAVTGRPGFLPFCRAWAKPARTRSR